MLFEVITKNVKSIRLLFLGMRKKTIDYAIVGCLIILVSSVLYAILKLYIFFQRIDISIIIANIIVFVVVAAVMLFLLKRRSDIEERELLDD
jgi:putative flippase GtrA